jgi:hypothetical protein
MSSEVIKSDAAVETFNADFASFQEAMSANIGSGSITAFDLPRIKVPSGGGTLWQLQTLEGERAEPTIEGIIVFARDTRAYWATSADDPAAGNNPPDCSSTDGLIGIGTPGGHCVPTKECKKGCPLAAFKSDPKGGAGQACKAVRQLFFLRPGSMMPELIGLPPTSLKAARRYMMTLTVNGIPHFCAITRIGLEKQKNPAGKTYAVAKFDKVRLCTNDEIANARQFRDMIAAMVGGMGADVDTAQQEE